MCFDVYQHKRFSKCILHKRILQPLKVRLYSACIYRDVLSFKFEFKLTLSLFFPDYNGARYPSNPIAQPANAAVPAWLDNIACKGGEKSISDCPRGDWGVSGDNCQSASVTCTPYCKFVIYPLTLHGKFTNHQLMYHFKLRDCSNKVVVNSNPCFYFCPCVIQS